MLKNFILGFLVLALCMLGACKKAIIEVDDPPPETKEKIIQIITTGDTMYMWLNKETPKHRENFLKLTTEKFYDSCTFHRVIPVFMIQGGDPNTKDQDSTNDGYGGPGYTIPAEFHDSLKHVFGAVGAAHDGNPAKASNGSQFYIVVNPNGSPHLNNVHTVFGIVFSGMNRAIQISQTPRNAANRPKTPQIMDLNVVEMTRAELKTRFGFVPRQ